MTMVWILLGIFIPCLGFLLWASVVAIRISGRQMNADSKHLVRPRRWLYWGVVIAFFFCPVVGTVIGAVIGSANGAGTSVFAGTAAGGGVGLLVVIIGLVFVGPVKQGPENVPYSQETELPWHRETKTRS